MFKPFGYTDEHGVWQELNTKLADDRWLDQGTRDNIAALHDERVAVFKRMMNLKNPRKLRECAEEIERIEFALQREWGFTEDREFHTWWFKVPGCTCPKMDNQDPLMRRVVNMACPVHGERDHIIQHWSDE